MTGRAYLDLVIRTALALRPEACYKVSTMPGWASAYTPRQRTGRIGPNDIQGRHAGWEIVDRWMHEHQVEEGEGILEGYEPGSPTSDSTNGARPAGD